LLFNLHWRRTLERRRPRPHRFALHAKPPRRGQPPGRSPGCGRGIKPGRCSPGCGRGIGPTRTHVWPRGSGRYPARQEIGRGSVGRSTQRPLNGIVPAGHGRSLSGRRRAARSDRASRLFPEDKRRRRPLESFHQGTAEVEEAESAVTCSARAIRLFPQGRRRCRPPAPFRRRTAALAAAESAVICSDHQFQRFPQDTCKRHPPEPFRRRRAEKEEDRRAAYRSSPVGTRTGRRSRFGLGDNAARRFGRPAPAAGRAGSRLHGCW